MCVFVIFKYEKIHFILLLLFLRHSIFTQVLTIANLVTLCFSKSVQCHFLRFQNTVARVVVVNVTVFFFLFSVLPSSILFSDLFRLIKYHSDRPYKHSSNKQRKIKGQIKWFSNNVLYSFVDAKIYRFSIRFYFFLDKWVNHL